MWYKISFFFAYGYPVVLVIFTESTYYYSLLLIFKFCLLHCRIVGMCIHGTHVGVRRLILGADWLL